MQGENYSSTFSVKYVIILYMQAITRFAPSPTGYIHIGNLRSAIYPFLVAKQTNGRFILRIEDTDQARYVEGATELILDVLKWLGLNWDEGPEIGGPHAPYYQTERRAIYQQWAQKLIASGRAYADPTTPEEVEAHRKYCTEHKIPYLFRNFRPVNPPAWHPGLPLRFKAEPKEYTWHDEVMGDMHTGPEVLDDIILIKKDGLPTYNFAHIVDDAEMEVTHIMRGVEYLSSTPNYLALYEALGLEHPKFVSLPHLLAPTGNKKLGKRDGAKSATEYRSDGILPEALLNYLACLGWNDGSEQEIYSMSELIQAFSLNRIQTSGARYDETKLLWYNGQWIRKLADEQGIAELYRRTADFWPASAANFDDAYKQQVLSIIYDRLKTLSDLREMTTYFFADPQVQLNLIFNNKFLKTFSEQDLVSLLDQTDTKLAALAKDAWTPETLQDALNELLTSTATKPAQLFSLIRLALSFAPFSPALNQTLAVLGRETSLARLSALKTALLLDQQ